MRLLIGGAALATLFVSSLRMSAAPLSAARLDAARAPGAVQAQLPSVTLPPPLERVLRDYEREWSASNANALAELFADDGFVLQPGRAPVRGRAAIRAAYSGASGGALRLRALAYATEGRVGYIIGAYRYGEKPEDVGKFTLTLRRDSNDRWLIVSDMDNGNSR